jgi:hypothetical protein
MSKTRELPHISPADKTRELPPSSNKLCQPCTTIPYDNEDFSNKISSHIS